jgi:hypothetical protein
MTLMPMPCSIPAGRSAVRLILVCSVLLLSRFGLLQAQSGTFVVSGRVTERGGDRPVPDAVVQLGDDQRAVTDSAGRFEIRDVRPGRYPFTVEAFGYFTAQTVIQVFDDVEGSVQLDPQPVALDTIAVQPRRLNLRGRVRAAESGRAIPYATIRVAGAATSSTDAGTFRIKDLPAGPHMVIIEGYGWMPTRSVIDLQIDSLHTFVVEPDPITERMVEAQIERINTRSANSGYSRVTISRSEILDSRTASPVDVISSRAAVRIRDCPDPAAAERQLNLPMSNISICVQVRGGITRPFVYIDDRQVCGLEFLNVYSNALLQHIEVLRGGRVIYAYTSRFIEDLAADRVKLQPFVSSLPPIRC